MPLLLDAPNLGEREKAKLAECIDSTYVSTAGPFVPAFEAAFARYLATQSAVALQSGTAALHLALVALGIGPGDEVIVPALTFVASVNPVLYSGATPVLVDVDPMTWTLDIEQTAAAITARTKAIIPVHLYGNPCAMDGLCQLAEDYGIAMIEDATESLGALWREQPTGTLGDIGCFSFNGNKLLTTGGGGMLVTNVRPGVRPGHGKDRERGQYVKFLANQARDTAAGYFHPELGYNYRMTNIEAALGLAQLDRIDEFLTKKQSFSRIYREVLADTEEIVFQQEPAHGRSAWWLPSFTLAHGSVTCLQNELKANDIPTRRIFYPLHRLPYLQSYHCAPCPQAERIYAQGLNLPASTVNDEASVLRAAEQIRTIIRQGRG